MSGYFFRNVFIGFYIGKAGFILSQDFCSLSEFFLIVFAFICDEAATFSDEREAPAGKLFKICNCSGYADIESFAVFRLL